MSSPIERRVVEGQRSDALVRRARRPRTSQPSVGRPVDRAADGGGEDRVEIGRGAGARTDGRGRIDIEHDQRRAADTGAWTAAVQSRDPAAGQRRPTAELWTCNSDPPLRNGHLMLPPKQGLYDPRFEHDACGVGFVADMHGRRSHRMVELGLVVALQPRPPRRHQRRGERRRRRRHPHPGARPRSSATVVGFDLPAGRRLRHRHRLPAARRRGRDGGSHRRREDRRRARACSVLGWRDVPYDDSMIGQHGPRRRAVVPAGVHPAPGAAGAAGIDLDRRCFVARKRIEHELETGDEPVYFPSCRPAPSSTRACSPPTRSTTFFPDLLDERLESRASRWCTAGSRPTRSRRGRSPTRTGSSPTTARSTRSWATRTGSGPARRCSTPTCIAGPRPRLPDLHARQRPTPAASTRCSSCSTSAAAASRTPC